MLVPNIITLLALCAGLTAIRLTIEGRIELALGAIVFAAVLDGVDGRVARLIKGQSKFGAELDSLADFVNFGVVPALILYFWKLNEIANVGWIAVMVFAISVGLRLARFNATLDDPNKPAYAENFFTGVPAPAGALCVLLPIYLSLLGAPALPATVIALYVLVDRVPDGVAPAGVLRQEDRRAGAARDGAAGHRRRHSLHRAPDRLPLACAERRHACCSCAACRSADGPIASTSAAPRKPRRPRPTPAPTAAAPFTPPAPRCDAGQSPAAIELTCPAGAADWLAKC